MSILKVPGAQLFYEGSGHGPLLILIPGASGTGASFRPLARELIARYQVVTYDRRGFSRSSLDGPQDDEHRLATDADDVRCLIEHLTDQSAIVFGNSSGAIVALEVLIQAPSRVQTVVAHEPPVGSRLSDSTSEGRTNSMANHLKHVINHMSTPAQHSQKVGNPTKASASLKERVAAAGSPLLSVLPNLHYLMAMLMKVMLLTAGVGVMSATRDSPWIRRGMLLVALLTASFTLYRLLSRKHTRWVLLLRSISLLFTAGMITWSIMTFGF